jgi:hypothetical protein
MKESHGERLATSTGPESCTVARKGRGEALTGEWAGRVLSRERRDLRGADAVDMCGRQHPARRERETQWNPARSKTPCTSGSTSHENREIRGLPITDGVKGRVGKSKDARRR